MTIDKDKAIYTICVIGFPKCDTSKSSRSRCWGFYYDMAEAREVIEHNHTDIFEMQYYQYAVIEKYLPGVLALAEEVAWFHAVYPETYEGNPIVSEIQKPEFAQGACNWSY